MYDIQQVACFVSMFKYIIHLNKKVAAAASTIQQLVTRRKTLNIYQCAYKNWDFDENYNKSYHKSISL